MVFEKTPRKDYCQICSGAHSEEHKSHKKEQNIVELTGTGKALPAVVLAVIFILIFAYTLQYTGA